MRSKDRPYVLFVAEVIYSKICEIKNNNLNLSNIDAIESFIGTELYNEIGSGTTASKLIFHGKFGTAANNVHEFKLPGAGIYADTGIYADVTNCDFFYIVGTF